MNLLRRLWCVVAGHDILQHRFGGWFCRRCHGASDYQAWQDGMTEIGE